MLSGLKLMWYNLMSYKYRDVRIKSGNVVLGHYYFDVSEDIVIPGYQLKFHKPVSPEDNTRFPHSRVDVPLFEELVDGHILEATYDISANRPAICVTNEQKEKIKAAMLEAKDDVKEFLEQHKEYFRELCDLDEQRDSVGIDFDTYFIPAVDPHDDYKDHVDTTIEKINKATNSGGGLFGNFKLEWYHWLIVGLAAFVAARYVFHIISWP
jgi:hypothetical protein